MSSVDARGKLETDPFTWRATKSGIVFIERGGKTVTTLRGKSAEQFLARVANLDDAAAQQVMARVTGHYRHGNER